MAIYYILVLSSPFWAVAPLPVLFLSLFKMQFRANFKSIAKYVGLCFLGGFLNIFVPNVVFAVGIANWILIVSEKTVNYCYALKGLNKTLPNPTFWLYQKIESVVPPKIRYFMGFKRVYDMFDMALFLTVSSAVYLYLVRRKNTPKWKAQVEAIKTEGVLSASMVSLIKNAMRVGLLATALVDLGRAVAPKQLYRPSLIIELIGLILEFVKNDKTSRFQVNYKKRTVDESTSESSAESDSDSNDIIDDDEVGVPPVADPRYKGRHYDFEPVVNEEEDDGLEQAEKFISLFAKVKTLLRRIWKHIADKKVECCVFTLAVLTGVCVYLVFNIGLIKTEGKGKNKSGRGASKNAASQPLTKKRKHYVIYDENDLSGLWFNDEPVSIADYVGKPLDKGTWIFVREDMYGNLYEEVVDIGDDPQMADAYEGKFASCSFCHAEKISADHEDKCLKNPKVVQKPVKEPTTTKIKTAEQIAAVKKARKARHSRQKIAKAFAKIQADKALIKTESLVATSPTFPTQMVSQAKGRLLDSESKFLCDCLCTVAGIIVNKHVVADAKFVEVGGKKFPMTKQKVCKILLHDDLVFCELFDGAPALSKKHFAVPTEVAMKVTVLSSEAQSYGSIESLTSNEISITASTKPGWCGSPYIDSNGRVIGIHFSAGVTGKTNVGMKVTDALLGVLGEPQHPKNF